MKARFKCFEVLRAKAEGIGASLDEDDWTLTLDAKPGYEWTATGTTLLCCQYATDRETWAVKAVASLEEDAKMGMELITDEDRLAEIEHEKEQSWRAPFRSPAKIEWPR